MFWKISSLCFENIPPRGNLYLGGPFQPASAVYLGRLRIAEGKQAKERRVIFDSRASAHGDWIWWTHVRTQKYVMHANLYTCMNFTGLSKADKKLDRDLWEGTAVERSSSRSVALK